MTTDASVHLVQRFVELREAGDEAGAVEHLDPEVRILVPAPMPYGGTWKGRAGALALLAAHGKTWSSWVESPVPVPLAAAGARVYREATVEATSATTGRSLSTSVTEVFEVRDGQIAEIRTYMADVSDVSDVVA